MIIKIETHNTLKRPWVAKLEGVEEYTHVDDEQVPSTRMRFKREFGVGVSVLPAGSEGERRYYNIDIFGSGVYELRSPGKLSDFYVAHDGKVKKVANPFPDNWVEYMRDNGTDYETTWWDIWSCLRNRYERFSGVPKAPAARPQADEITDEELEELIKNDLL